MFDQVFGHERVKQILAGTVAKDQLHHGLCFYGPSGIGKRLVATRVAKAMMCEQRNGCNECNHCRKFDNGNHPDFKFIEPSGADIKVDQIREISENLHFRPFEARCRMIVLDGVERLREESANAFLKSLEEPPDYVYFILITSDIKGLLPTIASRCQKIAFQSLNPEDKANILKVRFNVEEELATRLAAISFRQLETDAEAWRLFEEDVKIILKYFDMMIGQGHALDYVDPQVRDKTAFPRFLDHFTATARELTLLAQGLPFNSLYAAFEPQMRQLAAARPAALWRTAWEDLARLHGLRRRNLNLPLVFNTISLTGLGSLEASGQQLKQRLNSNRGRR